MILFVTTVEQARAVVGTFGELPTEFAFGNCVAWLELSAESSPIAACARRAKGGWMFYYDKRAISNELTQLLNEPLNQFNTNPCFITVHYAIRN